MRVLLVILLAFFVSIVNGQTRPSGFPTQLSSGWFRQGYQQSDSATIIANRDTLGWLPRFNGTMILRPQDKQLYFYDSTQLRWFRLLKSGDVSSVTASNGLTKIGDDIRLGGNLIQNTTINGRGVYEYNHDSLYSMNINTIFPYQFLGEPYYMKNSIVSFESDQQLMLESKGNNLSPDTTVYRTSLSINPQSLQILNIDNTNDSNSSYTFTSTEALFSSKLGIAGFSNARLHVGGTGLFTDTLKLPNILSKNDTSSYKPVVIDVNGNIFKLTSWPAGGGTEDSIVVGKLGTFINPITARNDSLYGRSIEIVSGGTIDTAADGHIRLTLTGTGNVTGTGTAGQATYWSGTTSVTGESAFTYDASINRLGVDSLLGRKTRVDTAIVSTAIGIGTNSPAMIFDLRGFNGTAMNMVNTSSSFGQMAFNSSQASWTAGFLGITPSIMYFGTSNGRPLTFYSSNIERMRIDENGKVGINVTAPAYRLQIRENDAGTITALRGISMLYESTVSTTAASRETRAISAINTATESVGANVLTNIGLYASANRGDINYAILADTGTVHIGLTSITDLARGLYVNRSIGAMKDSITTVSSITSQFILLQDTAAGSDLGRFKKILPANLGFVNTASNALTKTGTDISMGGDFTGNTTIGNIAQNFGLTINRLGTSNASTLSAVSSTGNAINATSTSGVAFLATTNTGSYVGGFTLNPATTNSIDEVVRVARTSSGTPANGLGAYIGYTGEVSDNSQQEMGRLAFAWTDVTLGTRTSNFTVNTTNSGSSATALTVKGSRQIQGNGYGSGTFTGTPTYTLQVDASGNIIEGSIIPTNIYTANGTLTGDRSLSGAEVYDLRFNNVDTFGVLSLGKIRFDGTTELAKALDESITVSAAGTLSMGASINYVASGTTATFTLPTGVTSLLGRVYKVKNRGSGNLTIDVADASATIYDTAPATTHIISAGGSREFVWDGTYWLVRG